MQPEMTANAPTTSQPINNPLDPHDPNEEVICEIRRASIGLLPPYFVAAVVVILAVAAALLVPYYVTTLTQQSKLGIVLTAILVSAATLLYVYIATLVYTANRWILTNENLTQISQTGLTTTQSSQLGLEELEDITVNKSGIIQMLLGYGTLRAETAGEHGNFIFIYCPTPDEYARKILAAREAWVERHNTA